TPETALENVGAFSMLPSMEKGEYCGVGRREALFAPSVYLLLERPFTFNHFDYPVEGVDQLMARLGEGGDADRNLYGRMRFRVLDSPGVVSAYDQPVRSQLRGNLVSVDLFLDPDL